MLKVAPLSVSGLLRTALFDRTPVAMTSATLTVGGGFDALLGLARPGRTPEAETIDVGSPFDHARQGILYVAKDVPPPGPRRGGDGGARRARRADRGGRRAHAGAVQQLARASSGRPSTCACAWATAPTSRCWCSAEGMRSAAWSSGSRRIRRSTLLGTVSLWQGVDVPGESCILVVIDRIPFPRPDDPLLAARQKAVDDAGGSGFRAVSVPRAGTAPRPGRRDG